LQPVLRSLGWSLRLEAAWAALARPDLQPARVTAQHRGEYEFISGDGPGRAATAGALLHHASGPQDLPVVGDWVGLRTGLIEVVLPRTGALVRKLPGEGSEIQMLAANVDTTLVVASVTNEVNLRRIERFLTLAWEGGAPPLVVLTKVDLIPEAGRVVRDAQTALGTVPVVGVSNVTGEGFDELALHLEGTPTLAALGPSGVGKSTLINRLMGEDVLATAEVREDGKGRHTTSHRQLLFLPGGGALIDTPGLREVGLAIVEHGIEVAFEDVAVLAAGCRFPDCSHEHEPDCAVRGTVSNERLNAYRKQVREAAAMARKVDKRLAREEARKWDKLYRDAKTRARQR